MWNVCLIILFFVIVLLFSVLSLCSLSYFFALFCSCFCSCFFFIPFTEGLILEPFDFQAIEVKLVGEGDKICVLRI